LGLHPHTEPDLHSTDLGRRVGGPQLASRKREFVREQFHGLPAGGRYRLVVVGHQRHDEQCWRFRAVPHLVRSGDLRALRPRMDSRTTPTGNACYPELYAVPNPDEQVLARQLTAASSEIPISRRPDTLRCNGCRRSDPSMRVLHRPFGSGERGKVGHVDGLTRTHSLSPHWGKYCLPIGSRSYGRLCLD